MDETVKIFISSRQKELEQERAWAREAIEEIGKGLVKLEPITVEHKAAPPSTTIFDQCLVQLRQCKAVTCIYYKTISEIVKNEFHWANERGVPIFIFKKEPEGREHADRELKKFIKEEVSPPSGEGPYKGYVYKTFTGKDIKDKIKASLKEHYPFNKAIPEKYLPSAIESGEPERLERIRHVYVKPHCYDKAEEILKNNHILIITGPAHLGKTSMGFHLADSFQKNNISKRFLVFPESGDICEMVNHPDSVIVFDDPFGSVSYQPSPTVDISDKLRHLALKNYVIVTSRREVLNEAVKHIKLGERKPEELTIEMKQDDYSDEDFEEILERHLEYFQAGLDVRKLSDSHKWEILKELRFPHNYEVLVREELGKVIKGEKGFQHALEDAKEIERAVGEWFNRWYEKDKEVFYFLLVLALCEELEEEDFFLINKRVIEKLNKERHLGLPLSSNLARLKRVTASYVSQSDPSQVAFQYGAFQEDAFQVSVPLRLEHPSYREGILSCIKDFYLDDALPVLERLAKDKAYEVHYSLEKMGKGCPGKVLPILERLVKCKFSDVRFWAASAMTKVGLEHSEEVIPVLERLAKDKNLEVRCSAIDVMEKIGEEHSGEVLSILEGLIVDESPKVRSHAAWALGEVGEAHPGVIPILERLIMDENGDVAASSASALGNIGKKYPEKVVPLLKGLAKNEDSSIRIDTTMALREIGKEHPSEALPILEYLAGDGEPYVRINVSLVLRDIGKKHPKKALSILERLARDRDSDVRFYAISVALSVVGKEHPLEVRPILERLVTNEDDNVRMRARWVLKELG